MTKDAQIIDSHISQLSEHFDAIQILATRLLPNGNTRTWDRGSGNAHTRINMAREYVAESDERVRLHIRQQESDDDGPELDAWK